MSATLTLAGPAHLEKLDALVAACHAECGLKLTDAARRDALHPLLDGLPHGSVYLIGPSRAPIGYIMISFGWSIEHQGLVGHISEMFLRKAVRGRGIATEVLQVLPPALADAGLRALHMEVANEHDATNRLCKRSGFVAQRPSQQMTRRLADPM